MRKESCLPFVITLASIRAHHLITFLDDPENTDKEEELAGRRQIQLEALQHLADCEMHADVSRYQDPCQRHEAIIWLERYLYLSMDDVEGLERPSPDPLLLSFSERIDEFQELRIEHARTCKKHVDELDELRFIQEAMSSAMSDIASAASANTELLTQGDQEKESHLAQFLARHLGGKTPIEE